MSPMLTYSPDLPNGFPRVSGDEPEKLQAAQKASQFSPRERG